MHQQQTAFENIVGKEEIAHKEQFLLFPQCFLLNQKTVSPFFNIYDIISFLLLNWKRPKLACEVKSYDPEEGAFANTWGKKNQRTEGPESRTDGETLIFWD